MAFSGELFRDYPHCPVYKNCEEPDYTGFSLGKVPSYVGLVSDFFSCVASVAMVAIYIAWKDIRKKGAQSIITFIAIADFFTALSYMCGSVNMIVHYNYNQTSRRECEIFQTVCDVESYVVTWATMSSYLWTVILAFYFYLGIARNNAKRAMKMMPWYHVIAWGLPIAVVLPLLFTGKLTYAPFVSAVWCKLEVDKSHSYLNHEHAYKPHNIMQVVAMKLPEVLSYLIILVLYGITLRHTNRFRRSTPWSNQAQAVGRVEKVLIFIPVLFIILRIWGTVQFVYSVFVAGHSTQNGDCIHQSLNDVHVLLGVLQAIGGGGQGWANGILYIFVSPTIRGRLVQLLCRCRKKTSPQIQAPSSTFYSPPISNYKSTSTESVRNLM